MGHQILAWLVAGCIQALSSEIFGPAVSQVDWMGLVLSVADIGTEEEEFTCLSKQPPLSCVQTTVLEPRSFEMLTGHHDFRRYCFLDASTSQLQFIRWFPESGRLARSEDGTRLRMNSCREQAEADFYAKEHGEMQDSPANHHHHHRRRRHRHHHQARLAANRPLSRSIAIATRLSSKPHSPLWARQTAVPTFSKYARNTPAHAPSPTSLAASDPVAFSPSSWQLPQSSTSSVACFTIVP